MIAATGPSDSLDFYYQPIGAKGWHPEQVANGNTTWFAPSVAQVATSSVIVAQGPVGRLHFYYQPIGAKKWRGPQLVNCAEL